MKKIIACFAIIAAFAATANAQKFDYDGIELAEGNKVEAKLRIAFPMQFGVTTLLNPTYKGEWTVLQNEKFQDLDLGKSFCYSLEIAGVRFASKNGPFEVNLGLRYTFMDFALANKQYTFAKSTSDYYVPSLIADRDKVTKSKLHANYLGVPLRFSYKIGKAKVYAGAEADYCISARTKYKEPKTKANINGTLFNKFRASAEAGFAFGGLGLFVNYGITPVFVSELSDAHTITFGLTLGI